MRSDPAPKQLSIIHTAAFAPARGWSADEFASLIASPLVFVVQDRAGFALGRVIADEAELLTIAVAPDSQGSGMGRRLLRGFEANAATRGAVSAFLEVAQDNEGAHALYATAGWTESGRRAGYYAREGGAKVDAILMTKHLP